MISSKYANPEIGRRNLATLVAATLEAGNGRGDHGSLVVQGPVARRAVDAPETVPQLILSTLLSSPRPPIPGFIQPMCG